MFDHSAPHQTTRRTLCSLAALAAAGLIALQACSRPSATPSSGNPKAPPKRVFLITIDTLRADHLGSYGYSRSTSPFLDALAARGTLFERAFVQWPKTGPSFASIFTGLYPGTTGLKAKAAIALPAERDTLAELFRDHGYTTIAVVGNAVLDSELGWNQGFDEYVEPWTLSETPPETPVEWKRTLDATRITALALAALEAEGDAERLFAWIHYMDPHIPYVLPPGESNPFLAGLPPTDASEPRHIPREVRLDDRTDLPFYVAQYDANIAVADRWIASLFDRMNELGLLEDSLVVVTSDHGESLGERDYFGHGRQPYNNTLHVPLFFVDPARVGAGVRVTEPVELIDLFPSLEEVISGRRAHHQLDGRSLVPFLRGEGERAAPGFRFAYSEAGTTKRHTYRVLQNEEHKLVYFPGRGKRAERYELYRVDEDPAERRDLIREEAGPPDDLRALMSEWVVSTSGEVAEDAQIDAETERALRALGYIE